MNQIQLKETGPGYFLPALLILIAIDSVTKLLVKENTLILWLMQSLLKAVNDITTASNKYNQVNKNIFEVGKENLENWNKAVNAYFDENMPK